MTYRSIEFRLPALIGALLVAAVAASVWGAYQEVKRSALQGASDRLDRVTQQIADLVAVGMRQRLAELRRLADQPAVHAFIRAPKPATGAAALLPMQRFVAQSQQPSVVELWDAGGHRVVDGARVAGYVVERRHVATNPKTALQLAGLIGSDATLYIGNARGDLWTDFWQPVEPPPVDPAGRLGVLQYERHGSPLLARALPVASTPWLVLVEFPRDPVLARARAFLSRAALFALLLLGVGAAAVWAISRRYTRSSVRPSPRPAPRHSCRCSASSPSPNNRR